MNPIQFKLSGKTNIGCVRSNNEDNFIVNPDLCKDQWMLPCDSNTVFTFGKKGALLVVADGMGGLDAGEIASSIAIDTLKDYFASNRINEDVIKDQSSIKQFLKSAIIASDMNIKNACRNTNKIKDMGTTIVVAWILHGYVYVSWCGDSRLYIFDSLSGLVRITKDHSYVQGLIDNRKLTPEQAFEHPFSNVITRSLGTNNEEAKPDFIQLKLRSDMCLLLCTDGLNSMLHDFEIDHIMQDNIKSIDICRDRLINEALYKGGYDNITVILCEIMIESEKTENESMRATIHEYKKNKGFYRILLLTLILLIAVLLILFKLFG